MKRKKKKTKSENKVVNKYKAAGATSAVLAMSLIINGCFGGTGSGGSIPGFGSLQTGGSLGPLPTEPADPVVLQSVLSQLSNEELVNMMSEIDSHDHEESFMSQLDASRIARIEDELERRRMADTTTTT